MTSEVETSDVLLARSCGGDNDAFAALYERCFGRVFESVRSVLRDPAQSEEVAQEVMLEAWQNGAKFDAGQAQVSTWLGVIARRRAIDRVRASQASRTRDLRIGIRDWQEHIDDVALSVETRLRAEGVLLALRDIPVLQRRAIELCYFDDYSRVEVARALNVPLSTANWRIREGLTRLRALLAPDVIPDEARADTKSR
ncbi:sigma-70 family RNA polymerase sigma factor [Subtercola sp. RTI3]|uniref:sigma-70 family RNA polymerase sigma factor n=1 Tax=Subtercola sp. RTI3 TaxID=3048639 RepID=UPI002B234C69|nr:sigma-70 family RNA polymerase sigma factor [Subtercola sp. RTI3]MEA9984892.1 sigma-70 family RNA polymerase sigma factor [Subtercola sp. RTI3]